MTEKHSTMGDFQNLEQDWDLLQAIMEHTAVHLAYLDPEFNYIRANSAYARGLGMSVEELIGKNHFKLYPGSTVKAAFERVRDTGEPVRYWAMPIQFPDHPERGITYWDWALSPVKGEDGVSGLVLSSTEVTELMRERQERERLQEEIRRYTERLEETVIERTAALRASEARFRTIFENSTIGIALLNEDGQILTSNPMLQEMLGYSQKELTDTRLSDYYTASETREIGDSPVDPTTVSYSQVEKRYTRKDGEVRWGEVTLSRVKNTKQDAPRLAIAMVEDVTDERLNQQALLRAERLTIIGRLGASLAHEINNPLQSVIGCLGLADEMLNEEEAARSYLEIAMAEVERAADIVSYLRDLGREPSEKKAEPTDVNSLMEKALLMTRKRCQNGGVAVDWIPATDFPRVLLIPDGVQQVFLNIILNAVEAMPDGGRLRIRVALCEDPQGVNISFSDTGVGIGADSLPHLFDPLQGTRAEGMGLGLYISKNIVDAHRGKIEVDSRIGAGTTFTVWLPM